MPAQSQVFLESVGEPVAQGQQGQRRVRPAAGGKHAASRDEEILDPVDATIAVDDTVLRVIGHPGRADVMAAGSDTPAQMPEVALDRESGQIEMTQSLLSQAGIDSPREDLGGSELRLTDMPLDHGAWNPQGVDPVTERHSIVRPRRRLGLNAEVHRP
jgi:hypothetical protein